MKIAIYHNLPSGGAKRSLFEWTRRLVLSHRVDVYALAEADHSFCDLRALVHRHEIVQFRPHRLFRSPFGRLNQFQRWRDLRTLDRLGKVTARQIRERGYDVVFLNPCLRTFIPMIARHLRQPSIYYLQEPFGPTFIRPVNRPYLRETTWRTALDRIDPFIVLYHRQLEWMRRTGMDRISRLVANSTFTRDATSRAYGFHAHVVHLGVDSTAFRPLEGLVRHPHVLSVGALVPRKGFDFLIESLSMIPLERRPMLRLVSDWVSPDERAFIEHLARKREVRIEIRSRLNTTQLAVEYNEARFCLYAPVAEPFGLVPLEAMACGTAIIGVAEGGVSESIRHMDTGLLTPRDPAQFAAAITALLDDPAFATRLGARGRAVADQDWSWDASSAEIENQLRTVATREDRL